MKRTRNRLGQFTKKKVRVGWVAKVVALLTFPTMAICNAIDANRSIEPVHFIEVAEAEEVQKPKYIEDIFIINYDWSEEKTIEEIKKTFPDSYGLMIPVFKCESGLRLDARGPTNDWGIAQIHADTWDKKAQELGLDYKNNPYDNLKMARWIYDNAGGIDNWVCFTRGYYKKHL